MATTFAKSASGTSCRTISSEGYATYSYNTVQARDVFALCFAMTETQKPKRYWLFRFLVAVVRAIVKILLKLEVEGAERLPRSGPVLLIGNHVNFVDPALGYIINQRYVKGMTAAETRGRFLFNFFAWGVDAIYVERGAPDRRALKACIEALDAGWALYLAPEGTRSGDGRLQKGLSGMTLVLLRAGTHIPVYPIAYIGLEHFWPSIKRLRRTPVRVVVGQPFYVSPPEGRAHREVREQITAEMMGQIAAMLPVENRGLYAEQADKTPQYLRFAPDSGADRSVQHKAGSAS
jgi:1-acyl-sn-glycerol-3-phosphate acyltransferase